jgi:hypothetical protein
LQRNTAFISTRARAGVHIGSVLPMNLHIRRQRSRLQRSTWAVLRWTFAATLAAASFAYMLGQMTPANAIVG